MPITINLIINSYNLHGFKHKDVDCRVSLRSTLQLPVGPQKDRLLHRKTVRRSFQR